MYKDRKLAALFSNFNRRMGNKEWDSVMGEDIMKVLRAKSNYSRTAIHLLRALRNISEHWHEIKNERAFESFESDTSNFFKYFDTKFPNWFSNAFEFAQSKDLLSKLPRTFSTGLK